MFVSDPVEQLPQVAHRRTPVGKLVLGRAIELARPGIEARRPAGLEHQHDVVELERRRHHDLPDRVFVAELALDVMRDPLELLELGLGVEPELHPRVRLRVHLRELAGPRLEERLLDVVVPAQGLENANGLLRLHDTLRELRDDLLVAAPRAPPSEAEEYSAPARGTERLPFRRSRSSPWPGRRRCEWCRQGRQPPRRSFAPPGAAHAAAKPQTRPPASRAGLPRLLSIDAPPLFPPRPIILPRQPRRARARPGHAPPRPLLGS